PGSGAILAGVNQPASGARSVPVAAPARVLGPARSGSIVVMHDGGGFRGQTVAALPGIIKNLKARGFDLVTVSEVLGERMLTKP
ncbi:MAG: hypothetical protein ACR2N5_03750, partial [Solirubrobacterales bacterium]